ncbi:MAG: permease prefix domain 1-containing protein [Actinomycetota bacterium]
MSTSPRKPTESSHIHRHLDAAFAGIEMTPDAQDLKEEIRGNLAARSAELQSAGVDPTTAAETAVRELGDIRPLIGSLETGTGGTAELIARNRVRPNPGFVVRALLLSLVLAAGIVLVAVAELSVLSWPIALVTAISAVSALALGGLVVDSLSQETSQDYPMPRSRAIGFGLAAAALGGGLLFGSAFAGSGALVLLIPGIALFVAAIAALSWLGVTQTNRAKPWALELRRSYEGTTRFDTDPAAAARFGMYTVIIWLVGIAGFVVLTIAVGFTWSWLALLAALVVFFLVLSRMLFTSEEHQN